MPINNKTKQFDGDLDFGRRGERWVEELFEGRGLVEVKTERDLWVVTGNIAFEYRSRGVPSGIATTKAKWWIHVLTQEGIVMGALVLNVDLLKVRLKDLLRRGMATKQVGGDDNTSELLLVSLRHIKDLIKS